MIIEEGRSRAEVEELMEEIREENELLDEEERKVRRSRMKMLKRFAIAGVAVVLLLIGGYVYVTGQTYNKVHILNTYASKSENGEQYTEFADGILKYSRDGAAFLNKKGKEQWNSAYQYKNPIVSVKKNSAAIADKEGNDISVFRKNGLKGEIHTNLPIEKMVVSGQGIVGVALKDETTSRIVCYDAAGNILVEHKISAAAMGYPMDLAISDNGYMLLVSYLVVQDGQLASRITYYNFGEEGQKKDNYIVTEDTYEDVIIPSVFFMDNQTSAVVADNAIIIYKGKNIPQKSSTVNLKNSIKSMFHNERYIGIVSQNKEGNEMTLYDDAGGKLLSQSFEGEYKNIKVNKDQVFMYEGKKCNIFSKTGIHKFKGELETDIIDIFPLPGINKYLVINANGLEEIRFAK